MGPSKYYNRLASLRAEETDWDLKSALDTLALCFMQTAI